VTGFKAYRVFEEAGKVSGRLVEMSIDELSAGDVVIEAAYSSVNYKDALAATGAGKIIRRFPLIGGIDVSGTVASSADARFKAGRSGARHRLRPGPGARRRIRAVRARARGLGGRGPRQPDALRRDGLGTAGFTAALSIVEMEHNGLEPASGPVIVTGATGGVGSLAVQSLAARGYLVTALTGKDQEADFLRGLGAADVLLRGTLQMGTRPLEKAMWGGAVDAVGGDILAWLTRTMKYGACIASSGLTAGPRSTRRCFHSSCGESSCSASNRRCVRGTAGSRPGAGRDRP
jgi:NADPH2:quinone reductase